MKGNELELAHSLSQNGARPFGEPGDRSLSREDPKSGKNVSELLRLGSVQVVFLVLISVLLNITENVLNLWLAFLWTFDNKIQGFTILFFIGLSHTISSVAFYFEASIMLERYLSALGMLGLVSPLNGILVFSSQDHTVLIQRLLKYTEMRSPQLYLHTTPVIVVQIFVLILSNAVSDRLLIASLCINVVALAWATLELNLIRDRFCFVPEKNVTVRDLEFSEPALPEYVWGWRYVSMGVVTGADLVLRSATLALYFGTTSWYPWSIVIGSIGLVLFEVLVGIGVASLDFGEEHPVSVGIFGATGFFSGGYMVKFFHTTPNYESISAIGFLLRLCISIAAVSTVYGAGNLELHWLALVLIAMACHLPALALPWEESDTAHHPIMLTQLSAILSATLSSFDVGTDIAAAVIFFSQKNYAWGTLLLLFVLRGNVVGSFALSKNPDWGCLYVDLEKKSDDLDEEEVHSFSFCRIWVYFGPCGFQGLMHGYSLWTRPRNKDVHDAHKSAVLQRSLFESFPAAALQIYVMALLQEYPTWLQLSTGFSVLSVGYGITQYSNGNVSRPGYVTLYLWFTLSADFLMRTLSGAVFLAVTEYRPMSIVASAVGLAAFEFFMILGQLVLGDPDKKNRLRHVGGAILFSWIGLFSGIAHYSSITSTKQSQRVVGLFEILVRMLVAVGMIQATMFRLVPTSTNPYAFDRDPTYFNITWFVMFVSCIVVSIIGGACILWYGLTYKASLVVPALLRKVRQAYQPRLFRSPYAYEHKDNAKSASIVQIGDTGYTSLGAPVVAATSTPAARRLSVELVNILNLEDRANASLRFAE